MRSVRLMPTAITPLVVLITIATSVQAAARMKSGRTLSTAPYTDPYFGEAFYRQIERVPTEAYSFHCS